MLRKLSTLIRSNHRTSALLVVFCALVICTVIFSIDRITGIISGYLATIVLAIALTYNWRKISMFLILLVLSAVGFFVLAFLHEVIYVPKNPGDAITLQRFMMELFHIPVSIIVAFVCPVGFSVGVVGCVKLWLGRGKDRDIKRT